MKLFKHCGNCCKEPYCDCELVKIPLYLEYLRNIPAIVPGSKSKGNRDTKTKTITIPIPKAYAYECLSCGAINKDHIQGAPIK